MQNQETVAFYKTLFYNKFRKFQNRDFMKAR